jgi:hypothetical protein
LTEKKFDYIEKGMKEEKAPRKKPKKTRRMTNSGLSKRKYSPSVRYDRDIICEQLKEWGEKDTSINLCEFCAVKGYLPSLLWSLEKSDEAFNRQFTLTKLRLAERRERMLNARKLDTGSFHRSQRSYDAFLKKDEDEKAERDAALRVKIEKQKNINVSDLMERLNNKQIKQPD